MKTLLRYARLYLTFVRVAAMEEMAYRPHFVLMVAGKVLRMALLFFFFQALFLQVDRIGNWDYDGVLLLFATFQLVDYLMSITFQRNLAAFLPRRIHTGELDDRMLLPVSLLFLVSFEVVDLMDLFSCVPAVGFLAWVLARTGFAFTAGQAIAYLALLANALVFIYSVFLIVAALAFWTIQSAGLSFIVDNLLRIARYPSDILGGFWKVALVYFFPVVLVAQVPAEALRGTLSLPYAAFGCAATGLFLAAALALWRRGLRSYLSASS